MLDITLIVFQILLGLWLADFATGFVHWIVDNYGNPEWPVIGPHHIAHSHNHHDAPLELFALPVLPKHGGIVSVVALVGLALWASGAMTVYFAAACVFGALTNIIHGWSHVSAEENGPLITACHAIGLFQSQRHHVHHHTGTSDTHYCLLTDHVNPVIETIRLWPLLERGLATIGIRKHWWITSA